MGTQGSTGELLAAAISAKRAMDSIWETAGRNDAWIYDEMGSELASAYFLLRKEIEKAQRLPVTDTELPGGGVMGQLIGPFSVDLKVHVENDTEGTIGAVTFGLPPGQVPTLEDIHRAIGRSLRALPDGYALLNGDDFFNKVLVKEKTGRTGNFATPASFNFDVDALTAAALSSIPEAGDEVGALADGEADEDEYQDWDE